MKPLINGQSAVALGLMSGTSLDGIDAALIETDGAGVQDFGPTLSAAYSDSFRARLKAAVEIAGRTDQPLSDEVLIEEFTQLNIEIVERLLSQERDSSKWKKPDVIGFHGHTTLHRPSRQFTQQIGNPVRLAVSSGIPVVSDFRIKDVEVGGQGAPLVPIFHHALCRGQDRPTCFANIGGISNITWIGEGAEDELVAFDTGPGNGLLDSWVEQRTGHRFDAGGSIAAKGEVNFDALQVLLDNPYFERPHPKSLDRSDFNLDALSGLSTEDGAATLVAFTVSTIVLGLEKCTSIPEVLYVTGGGRHNKTIMARLEAASKCPVYPVEQQGWKGDFIEAQAFGFLAVRSCQNLPITFPGTTGVDQPIVGGDLTQP